MMKNKYISIIAAFCSLAAVSCSRQMLETYDDGIIRFSAYKYLHHTKAGETVVFPIGEDFSVRCYRTENPWSSTAKGQKLAIAYIDNAKASWDSGKSVFQTTPAYKWTETSSFHFAAYSPYSETDPMTVSLNTAGNPMLTFTDWSDATMKTDLRYADIVMDKKKNANTVDLVFHHALSQVILNFSLAEIPEGMKPTVSSVALSVSSAKLIGASTTGTLEVNADNDGKASWSSLSGSSELSLGSIVASSADTLFVIPQSLGEDAQKLQISYTLTVKYKSDPTSPETFSETDREITLNSDSVSAWTVNGSTAYNFKFDAFAKELTFTANQTDWIQQGGAIETY